MIQRGHLTLDEMTSLDPCTGKNLIQYHKHVIPISLKAIKLSAGVMQS